MYKSEGLLCEATSLVENVFVMVGYVDTVEVKYAKGLKISRVCYEKRNEEWK